MCRYCIKVVLENPEMLRQYDRLLGTRITKPGILQEIDKATGKFDRDLERLAEFIHERIHEPVFGQQGTGEAGHG